MAKAFIYKASYSYVAVSKTVRCRERCFSVCRSMGRKAGVFLPTKELDVGGSIPPPSKGIAQRQSTSVDFGKGVKSRGSNPLHGPVKSDNMR